jgi:hypothetical protein
MNMLATTVNISQSGIAEECSETFSIRALSSRETIVCSYVVEDADFGAVWIRRSIPSQVLPCLITSAPEDGDSMFLRNVGIDLRIRMAPKPKTSTTT